jgi:hypothetical protein
VRCVFGAHAQNCKRRCSSQEKLALRDIADIPELPDRATRLAEVTVDCYGREEELSAFEVYLTDALRLPFAATWRDPDEPGFSEQVTVEAVADLDERRGVLLQVRRRGGKTRRAVAEQIWANATIGPNAIVLDDYRYWVEHGGLDY